MRPTELFSETSVSFASSILAAGVVAGDTTFEGDGAAVEGAEAEGERGALMREGAAAEEEEEDEEEEEEDEINPD